MKMDAGKELPVLHNRVKWKRLLSYTYLCPELDKDHVLVWGGVSDNAHVLNGRVTGCSELEKVMDGHGGWDS